MSSKLPLVNLREALRLQEDSVCEKLAGNKGVIYYLIKNLADAKQISEEQQTKLLEKDDTHEQIKKLLCYLLRAEGLEAVEAFVRALKGEESSTVKTVLYELETEAHNHVTPVLEIELLLKKAIQRQGVSFIENLRNAEKISTKLYSEKLITTEEAKAVSKLKSPQWKLLSILKSLQRFEDQLKYIEILKESNNATLAGDIVTNEIETEITSKKERAVQEMVNSLKNRYKKYQTIVLNTPGGPEVIADFSKEDAALMELEYTAHVPTNAPRNRKDRKRWKSGEKTYRDLPSLDSLKTSDYDFNFVLLQGDPGCGKTTLFRKWLFEFSKEPANCSNNNSPILVHVPMKNVRQNDLSDIVFNDIKLLHQRYERVFRLMLNDPELSRSIIFLVDGLDENRSVTSENCIFRLVTRSPEITSSERKIKVFATCRMYQSVVARFRPHADIVITLCGVEKSSQEKFVEKHLDLSPTDSNKFLDECKEIFDQGILSIPIYLALLCVLAKQNKEQGVHMCTIFNSYSKNKVGVFDAFINMFKQNYLKHLQKQRKFKTLTEKTTPEKENKDAEKSERRTQDLFYKLGHLSLDGLLQGKDVFTEDDFMRYRVAIEDVEMLGVFIHSAESLHYKFWHQTLAEYFAGVYYCRYAGFEKSIVTLLSKNGLLEELPNVMTEALKQALPHRSSKRVQNKQKGSEYASYLEKRKECFQFEKNCAVSLRETLSPLDGCFQFACGKNMEFAKQLFQFAKVACRLISWKTEGEERLYDTRFECSLMFEADNVKLFDTFVDFLCNCDIYEHWKHGQSLSVNSYHNICASYVVCKLPPKLKFRVYRTLYQCGLYKEIDTNKTYIVTSLERTKITDDLLLYHLPKENLPEAVHINGDSQNMNVFRYLLEQREVQVKTVFLHRLLDGDALGTFGAIIPYLSMKGITHMTLSFCTLTAEHFQLLASFVDKTRPVSRIVMDGCDMEKFPASLMEAFTKVYPISKTTFEINQNTLTLTVQSEEITVFVLRNSVCSKIHPLLSNVRNLEEVHITKSMLYDTAFSNEWRTLCDILSCQPLTVLRFEDCNLSKDVHLLEIQNVLEQVKTIEVLSFANNVFESEGLPLWKSLIDTIKLLPCLRSFSVDGCHLNSERMSILFNAMENLQTVKELKASKNQLNESLENTLVSMVSHPSLERVSLKQCFAPSTVGPASSGITKPVNLTVLNLSGTLKEPLSDESSVNNVLISEQLQELDLSYCTLPKPLFKETPVSLRTLCLSGTNLGGLTDSEFLNITEKIAAMKCLQTLDLSRCCLTRTTLYLCLSKCLHSVTNLDLSDNSVSKVTDIHWRKFTDALGESQKLERLRLSNCDLQTSQLIPIGKTIAKCHNLHHLEISGNNLGASVENDWQEFCDCLSKCTKIRYLKLSKSKLIKMFQIQILMSSIEKLQNITNLNLTMSAFSQVYSMSASSIKLLQSCKQVQKLSLTQCGIRADDQLMELSYAISEMPYLYHINLSKNAFKGVSDSAWQEFCLYLGGCLKLNKLNLAQSELEQNYHLEGLNTILQRSNILQRLTLSGNNFGDIAERSWNIFCKGLESCCHLKKLKIENCNLFYPFHIGALGRAVFHLKELNTLILSRNSDVDILRLFRNYLNKQSGVTSFSRIGPVSASDGKDATELLKFPYHEVEKQLITVLHSEQEESRVEEFIKILRNIVAGEERLKKLPSLAWYWFLELVKDLDSLDVRSDDLDKVFEKEFEKTSASGKNLPTIQEEGVVAVSENTKYLFLERCLWTISMEDAWNTLVKSVQSCKLLQTLWISKCRLEAYLPCTREMVTSLYFLRDIDFSYNNLGNVLAEEWQGFLDAYKNVEILQHINLGNCSMRPDQIMSLAEKLKRCVQLQSLNLSSNNLSRLSKEEGVILFSQCISSCKQLSIISLANCSLTPGLFESLTNCLEKMVNVNSLDLSLNEFDDSKSGTVLSQILNTRRNWACLNFSGCFKKNQDGFLQNFTRLLPEFCGRLVHLDMSRNGLHNCSIDVWEAFVDSLSMCAFLIELDISQNSLSENFLHYFLDKGACLASLETLKINDNAIKHEDSEKTLKRLKGFAGLRTVDGRHFRLSGCESETDVYVINSLKTV